jgi:CheY-like chemotaxis protein
MDGFGFLEALRLDPLTGSIPVVVLTARERAEVLRDPRARLADAVLQKPFRLAALLTAVDSALALGQARGAG